MSGNNSSSNTNETAKARISYPNRQEPWEVYEEQLRRQRMTENNDDEIETAIINPIMDEDDEIPTEVVAEEDPICITDIVNNLESFVMRKLYIFTIK